ncbi:MAG: TRAP transporter substrate-binding protein DctP [Alphaproteobacteria bacterium]|nr:TRAP transporter substrate-binding protein DctP [Alphaproteobacteria bacterium]
MKSVFRKAAGLVAAAAMTTGMALSAQAADYVYNFPLPPQHNVAKFGLEPLFNQDLGQKWRFVTGGQLYSATAALQSVGRDVSEGTLVIPSLFSAQLKHAIIPNELLNLWEEPVSNSIAAVDFYFNDCPECLQDYEKLGATFLATYGAGFYGLLCNKKVTNLAEVKGKRIQAIGAQARWVEALGGTPVAASPSEMAQNLESGNMDCVVGSLAWLVSYPIADAVKYVLDYGYGNYTGVGLMVMNRKAWDNLSDDAQRDMWAALPAATARVVIAGYLGDDLKARDLAKEKGIVVTKSGNDIRQVWENLKKTEVDSVIALAKERGVENPRRIVDSFVAYDAKWRKLLKDKGIYDLIAKGGPGAGELDAATDALAKLIWDEIYSKIDPTKI